MIWKPSFFGAKPEIVIKGGVIAWAMMGDPNASIPTPEPVSISLISCLKPPNPTKKKKKNTELHILSIIESGAHTFIWLYIGQNFMFGSQYCSMNCMYCQLKNNKNT